MKLSGQREEEPKINEILRGSFKDWGVVEHRSLKQMQKTSNIKGGSEVRYAASPPTGRKRG